VLWLLVSPSNRIFTLTELKQIMFLGYIAQQLCCSYNLWHM